MSNYGTFGENNPVWKAINRYADMLLTGVLFVITCLPVVTIGASLCAFYYTAMDSLRKEDGYIFKRYFSSFGKNFKKATILWLIMLAVAAVLGLDVYFWLVNSQVQFSGVMLGISGILCFLWFMTFMFVFPLQTRFENSIGKTLQNAFMIGLGRLPFTVGVLVLLGIIGFLCASSIVIGAIVFFLGIGVVGYLLVYNYERFFKKCGYIAEDDGKIKNDDYDRSNRGGCRTAVRVRSSRGGYRTAGRVRSSRRDCRTTVRVRRKCGNTGVIPVSGRRKAADTVYIVHCEI